MKILGYGNDIYLRAIEVRKKDIKALKDYYEQGLETLRQSDPHFKELENGIATAGSAAAVAAFSGDEAELSKMQTLCQKLNTEKKAILDKAGLKKPEVLCPVCADTFYNNGGLCQCIKKIAKQIVFDELSSSLPLDNSTFDNFSLQFYSEKAMEDGTVPRKRAENILAKCKEFVEDFPKNSRSLLFMGGAGLGKTHLSLAIVSEIIKKGYGVVYGSAQSLFSAAEKEHFLFNSSSEHEQALLNCDLLVIDDLGTEFLSSYTTSLFYNIVNSRLLNKKPTIINTNLDFEQLENRYTARITSRFIGEYEMKKFVGLDIRQQKALK